MKDRTKVTIFLITFALVITLGISLVLSKLLPKNETEESTSKSLSYVNISVDELKNYLDNGKNIYLLDVHIPEQPHINGTDAVIPYNKLSTNKSKLPKKKDAEIIVYCRSGNMSKEASQELINMGYTNVKNLIGGTNSWKAKGYKL